ncbi:DUF4159 domain-containing protein [Candidatus Poribacteria bacterium]|nr:DUF4159 domain-containing protein [Candidatus Poribacteria bacterium]
MSAKRTSGALMTSLVMHVVFILIVALFFVAQTQTFKDILEGDVYSVETLKPPQVRKPIVKPSYSTEAVAVALQPRLTTLNVSHTSSYSTQTALEFSNKVIKVDVSVSPNVPKVAAPTESAQPVFTEGTLPVPSSPNNIASRSAVVKVPSGSAARLARGMADDQVQVKIAIERSPGLSMIDYVGATRDALESVVHKTPLGFNDIPQLPKRVPGGVIIGRGRDIRGALRFARVRHSLSDWWIDSSSLNALTKWINEKTKIRVDMNVEGGSLKLTDANLYKTPIVFMTGHDPAFVRSRNLLGRQYGGGKMDSRFTETEAAGLRKYLVEKGGFLVFDDCGVNAPAQAMTRLFISQMRYVMPEYQIERIDNKHEIYNNYYGMGGPPTGFNIFWWGARPPTRNYLEGISVGEKLSVLIVRRDYMCAMETISVPTRSGHYSPGVYRFMTNVIVYALTHGAISNYSGYVPEEALTKKELPLRAPQAAKIGATE